METVDFDAGQYRERVGDWVIRDHATIRRFDIQAGLFFNKFMLAQNYFEARGLQVFAFGLDLREKNIIEAQMTAAFTHVENDPTLEEPDRQKLLEFIDWHRSLYRHAIAGQISEAITALKAVGARQISYKPAR